MSCLPGGAVMTVSLSGCKCYPRGCLVAPLPEGGAPQRADGDSVVSRALITLSNFKGKETVKLMLKKKKREREWKNGNFLIKNYATMQSKSD